MNIFLVDGEVRPKAGAGPKSRPEKLKILELDTLETSLPETVAPLSYIMPLLGAKSSSNPLETAKLYKRFFQQVIILE